MRANNALAIALLIACCAKPVSGALVTAQDFGGGSDLMLSIRGTIIQSDEAKVRAYVARAKQNAYVRLHIESEGGDVKAAMGIGRLMRSVNARVGADKCYSACVLIFIGGVDRSVTSRQDKGWGLGLHRLYFAALAPGLSMAEISSKRRALSDEVRAYINSMNVSGQLFDLMEATPPEQMKLLSAEEVTALGLDQPDPVWDESVVAKEAHYYGISSMAYRQRRASLESRCPNDFWRKKTVVQEQAHIDCEEAARWGLQVGDYSTRWARYEAWRRDEFGNVAPNSPRPKDDLEFATRCRISFMVQGAAGCPH